MTWTVRPNHRRRHGDRQADAAGANGGTGLCRTTATSIRPSSSWHHDGRAFARDDDRPFCLNGRGASATPFSDPAFEAASSIPL